MIRHTANPVQAEFTLCGDAFDLGAHGEHPDPVFAAPGQVINCPQCRAIIVWCKAIKNWHEPSADVTIATREAFEG